MADDRWARERITLPPLSSLTSSLEPIDRRSGDASPAQSFSVSLASTSAGSRCTGPSHTRRGQYNDGRTDLDEPSTSSMHRMVSHDAIPNPVGMSDVRKTQVSASVSPVSREEAKLAAEVSKRSHHAHTTYSTSSESSRPRSYSSPQRHQARYAERESRCPPRTETDRLLESLIFVQDINRRLGLPTGPRASPAVIHSPDA
ncbi:hypothetical protein BCV70DRAFT_219772, partial [Testicularia cyperi]